MRKYLIALSYAAVTACNTSPNETEAAHNHHHDEGHYELTQAQIKMAGIEIGMPESRTLTTTITANGMVDVPPESLADISAPLGGFVRRAPHYEGTYVKKGALLVALEHPEYIRLQQEYLEVLGQYEMQALEFARQEKLYKSVAQAEKVLEQTRSNFKTIAARKEGLESTLRIAQIDPTLVVKNGIQQQVILRAPFNGYITMVAVNLGKQVGPEEILYQMVDPTHLHLELQAYPRDLVALKEGQQLRYRVQGSAEWKAGNVILVGQSVDPVTRTVRVHAHPETTDSNLKPGVFITAEIAVAEVYTTSLPEGAFLQDGEENFIFAKTATGFRKIAVEITKKGNGYYGFVTPALPGPYITKGAYYLTELKEEGHSH